MPDYEQIAARVNAEPAAPTVLSGDKDYLPLDHPKYQGLAESKGYQQEGYSAGRLKGVRYNHEAMIERILMEPSITQRQLASEFGVSESWISTVYGSDAFQAALAKRRDDLLDPEVIASIEERFKGAVHLSLSVITEKLEQTRNTDLALKTLDIGTKALGYGARASGNGQTNQFIIQLPPKAGSSEEWNDSYNPRVIKQLPSSEE